LTAPRRLQRKVLVAIALAAAVALRPAPGRAEKVHDLSRTLLRGKTDKERIAAAVALGRLRDARSVKPLIQALGDSNNAVRAVAAIALGVLGDAQALPALRKASEDPDKTVRRRATEAMALIKQGGAAGKGGAEALTNDPLANYKLDGRESPRVDDKPALYVVVKSAQDKTAGKTDLGTRRLRASHMKTLMVSELQHTQHVTTDKTEAEQLGIEPYAIDVTILKLDRVVNGPYVEIQCELRVAISNKRGKMISFLTGGAKVQVPKRTFNAAYEPQLRLEALENAVKSVHQDLITYLTSRPT
jgi:hypothetical protein